jgi:O-antigen/teichoic acid export membrane protein
MNTLQVLANQFLGVFIFLLLSRCLEKDIYGELNWSLAVLTLITTILSLRLEQIVVRNIAAGKDPSALLTLFTAHNLVTGTFFFGVLLAGNFLFPTFFHRHYILWILSISQLLSFFALPFRQLATGRSAFGWLAVISTVSNGIRCGWLGWLAAFSEVTLPRVLVVFTLSALVEFILGGYIVTRQLRIPFSRRQDLAGYRQLIRESLPQVGLVFLQAGIARIDWILMGFLSTPSRTAEYSFAYRAYEFSPLPLLVIAPFLLNGFARHFGNGGLRPIAGGPGPAAVPDRAVIPVSGAPVLTSIPARDPAWLGPLVRMQTIFATLLPLWLIIGWSPLVDFITHHKYGQVNALTFLILSCCLPFQYLVNIFWSAEFAGNRLALILKITAITGLIVVTGDVLLIPAYGGQGAALAYLAGMIVQYFLYNRASLLTSRKAWGKDMLIAVVIAAVSGGLSVWLTDAVFLRFGIASASYGLLTWGAGRLDRSGLRRPFLYPIPGKMLGK